MLIWIVASEASYHVHLLSLSFFSLPLPLFPYFFVFVSVSSFHYFSYLPYLFISPLSFALFFSLVSISLFPFFSLSLHMFLHFFVPVPVSINLLIFLISFPCLSIPLRGLPASPPSSLCLVSLSIYFRNSSFVTSLLFVFVPVSRLPLFYHPYLISPFLASSLFFSRLLALLSQALHASVFTLSFL